MGSTVVTTQQSNAAKQRVCAETLTKMYKVNQTPATTATDAGGCENPNGGAALAGGLSGLKNCRGSDVNAINYPIWKVKIGSAPAGTAPLATGACGRANKACAAPPASWT